MIEIAFGLIITGLWIAFEIYRAPLMDEDTGKTIKPGKKISELFKKRK
jgi:hypothetical protein